MTEAELWTLIVEYNVAGLTTFALYLTLISGFLAVAYLVGGKLTGWQIAITTVGFALSASFFTYAAFGYFSRAVFLIGKTSAEYQSGVMASETGVLAVISIFVLGILASLKFMWDVRHPKKV